MFLLITGLVLFWAAHALKIHAPSKRAELAARFGEGSVKGAATAALIGSVALMVVGYQSADFIAVWTPPGFLVHVNNLLMVVAILVFIAGSMKSWVRDKVRHPQLTGVKIWCLAHLLVNGDLASILLFGGMLAWAVVTMIAVNKRDGKPPRPAVGTPVGTVIHVVVALVLVVVVALAHNYFGVWPFAGGA